MNVRESISLALGSLRNNKMRSFLTLLGIIVGIASVITILTLGHSLKTQASESIVSSGANDLMVSVVQRPTEEQEEAGLTSGPMPMGMPNGEYIEPTAESKFDEDDIARLKEALGDNIAGIPLGANSYFGVDLFAGENEAPYTNAQFVNMDYLDLNPVTLVAGRSLTQADMDTKRPVTLLSMDQAVPLFGDPQAAVGSEIDVQAGLTSRTVLVVGVYQTEMASGPFAFNGPGSVYLPLSLEPDFNSYNSDGWNSITVRPAEGKDLGQVKALLQAHLTSMYRSDDQFMAEIQDFSAMTESFNAVLDGISAAISAIAGISLLVGGIGVMNIMLVTVTERTREIGIRKALGATRGAIRLQFVVEAMMVCLVGGILGVLIGGGLGMLGANMLGTFVFPPLSAVLLALGCSLAIGLFFGYYPANKAAKLDPIDALRYE